MNAFTYFFRSSVIVLFLLFAGEAFGVSGHIVNEGPIHEAFMTKESGQIILEAVTSGPPPDLEEQTPAQTDSQARWIPGYWAWSNQRQDFLWVSGVWRRTPPGCTWMPGYWKQFENGWAHISGFWTPQAQSKWIFLADPPPDAIDEQIPQSPNGGFFWISGYWNYDQSKKRYVWYTGRWEQFDPNWVYVPAHYYWREKGYIFVPAYWDWPLERKGVAYAAVFIAAQERASIAYTPVTVMETNIIIEICYPYYPYFLSCIHHHYHFNPELWNEWGVVPPWWAWDTWWSYTWFDQLWLFWWWSHPGFPNPTWITLQLSKAISAPPQSVLDFMKRVVQPMAISSNGVSTPMSLFNAVKKITGKSIPLLPTDAKQIKQIKEMAIPVRKPPFLKPSGNGAVSNSGPQKPHFGPTKMDLKDPPTIVTVPAKPAAVAPQTNFFSKSRPPSPPPANNRPASPLPSNNRSSMANPPYQPPARTPTFQTPKQILPQQPQLPATAPQSSTTPYQYPIINPGQPPSTATTPPQTPLPRGSPPSGYYPPGTSYPPQGYYGPSNNQMMPPPGSYPPINSYPSPGSYGQGGYGPPNSGQPPGSGGPPPGYGGPPPGVPGYPGQFMMPPQTQIPSSPQPQFPPSQAPVSMVQPQIVLPQPPQLPQPPPLPQAVIPQQPEPRPPLSNNYEPPVQGAHPYDWRPTPLELRSLGNFAARSYPQEDDRHSALDPTGLFVPHQRMFND